jgi:hypothetical protein
VALAQSWMVCASRQRPPAGTPWQGSTGVTQPFVLAEQLWPLGQATAAEKLKHPFESAVQVCTCVPEHCVIPASAQVFWQAGVLLPPQAVTADAMAANKATDRATWFPPRLSQSPERTVTPCSSVSNGAESGLTSSKITV